MFLTTDWVQYSSGHFWWKQNWTLGSWMYRGLLSLSWVLSREVERLSTEWNNWYQKKLEERWAEEKYEFQLYQLHRKLVSARSFLQHFCPISIFHLNIPKKAQIGWNGVNTNTMQHLNNWLNQWSLYEIDIFILEALKLSKLFCLFHGFTELSLFMNVKHFIAFVMKSSSAKSTSTKKQSPILSLPRVSWRSWKISFTFHWTPSKGEHYTAMLWVLLRQNGQTLFHDCKFVTRTQSVMKVDALQQLFFSVPVTRSSHYHFQFRDFQLL